jgi:hypothetical protein
VAVVVANIFIDRRRRRQSWPHRRRRCPLYPPPLPKFTAPTLKVATSVLVALLPCRVDRVRRAAHAPSQYPLVETRALRVPEAWRCQWQQLMSYSEPLHLIPPPRCPNPPFRLYLPVRRAPLYAPHHCRKATPLTQILSLLQAGKRWMTWKVHGVPEP